MVQGLKFLSKKSFHPQNHSNQKRVWEREQQTKQEQNRIREREAQLRREREDEELAKSRGDNKLQFLYKPPPGLETSEQPASNTSLQAAAASSDVWERQPGDDDAAAAFRRLLAGEASEYTTETDEIPTNAFGTVLQGSNADRSDAPKPVLTALEKSVGRKKHQHLTFDEQIQRFPALANAPRAKGVTATDVGVSFKPLGTQIRNVRCLACGIWGHSRGDRECAKTGWDPFAAKQPIASTSANMTQASDEERKRRKDDSSSSSEDDASEDRRRRHKRHRKSRDRSPSRKKRKEKKKSSKKSKRS